MVPVAWEPFIALAVVGVIAGFLAGLITRGAGFGLFGNMLVGIIGAFIGFYVADVMNVSLFPGLIGTILTAMLGAVILLFIVSLLRR